MLLHWLLWPFYIKAAIFIMYMVVIVAVILLVELVLVVSAEMREAQHPPYGYSRHTCKNRT